MFSLTIAIPVYKRPELLEKTLNSIYGQYQEWPAGVHVLILDDSCSDVNNCVYDQFSSSPNFAVIRNESNLGIDENIKKCIFSATTEYVWLMGEDDLLVAGSIEKVLLKIQKGYKFVFVNYVYVSGDHKKRAENPVHIPLGLGELDALDFYCESLFKIGFIGACVLQKDGWLSTDYSKYVGSYYSHVGGIVDSSLGANIGIIEEVCVLNRAEDVSTFTWSKYTFDVYFSFIEVLKLSKISEFEDRFARCLKTSMCFFKINRVAWLLAKRADGVYNLAIFRKYYYMRGWSTVFLVFAFIAAVLPRWLLRGMRRYHLKRKFPRLLAP